METYIGRPEAAQLLRVSLRTLDRYIRRKRMHIKKEGKNIFVLKEDLLRIKRDYISSAEVFDHKEEEHTSAPQGVPESQSPVEWQDNRLLRQMFEEYRGMLEKREEKIELLNYKLGQMEMKLKQSVPLLEHKKSSLVMDQKVKEQDLLIQTISQKYRTLAIVKNLYLAFFLLLLLVLPFLWFLFPR